MKKMSIPTTKTLGKSGRSLAKVMEAVGKQSTSKAIGKKIPDKVTLADISPEFLPDLADVNVTDMTVFCTFDDKRTVSFPLQWSDKLAKATASQRQDFDFNTHYIFWNEIDEIIGVRNILLGTRLHW